MTARTFTLQALAGAVLALALSATAHAVPVVLSDIEAQTVDGQDFTFSFSPVPLSDGNDGTLTIHARGDYDPGTATEFLNWDIDSLGIGGAAGPTIGGTTILLNNGINDVEWEQTFTISGADLLTITGDSAANVLIDLNLTPGGNGVNLIGSNAFVEVTLTYNTAVPEPATLGVLAAGLGLVGWSRRRRV